MHLQVNRDRRSGGERFQCGSETMFGQLMQHADARFFERSAWLRDIPSAAR